MTIQGAILIYVLYHQLNFQNMKNALFLGKLQMGKLLEGFEMLCIDFDHMLRNSVTSVVEFCRRESTGSRF